MAATAGLAAAAAFAAAAPAAMAWFKLSMSVRQRQLLRAAVAAAVPAAVLLTTTTALDSGRSEAAAGFMPKGKRMFEHLIPRGLCGLF